MSGFMQELSLLVIDEGQQYGTDREIAVISLLKQQPLVLWTGDSEQTPGGIDRAARNAKRSRQLLLAKKHGLRSDRNYYMPANLADAMIRLLDGSANEGLTALSQILKRGQSTSRSAMDKSPLAAGCRRPQGSQHCAPRPHEPYLKQLNQICNDTPDSLTQNCWRVPLSIFHGLSCALPGFCSMPLPSCPWLVTYKQS